LSYKFDPYHPSPARVALGHLLHSHEAWLSGSKSARVPDHSFQPLPRVFCLFVYSDVDDFVDGEIFKLQHVE